jgi:hypothetical protein
MSTLRVDNLQAGSRENLVPLSELRHRVIKTFRNSYRGGSWTPSFAYQWAPALFVDYTPASASSRIRFSTSISFAHTNGVAIAHCIFFANNVEQGRHTIAGQSPEHRHMYVWDCPSWGTSNARIGYQIRNYGSSNVARFHSTHHWDGSGSDQAAQTEIVIEEYFAIS